MNSAIARLVLHAHDRAAQESRVGITDDTATQVLATLRKPRVPSRSSLPGVNIGLELKTGRVWSKEARAIRLYAMNALRSYETFLEACDSLGYTPQIIRAALSYHWSTLRSSDLWSDGHCIKLDIEGAVAVLPERDQEVVDMMQHGCGPHDIGKELSTPETKVNGSRLVGKVLLAISQQLEQNYGTQRTTNAAGRCSDGSSRKQCRPVVNCGRAG